jgi:hypothetical protein
MKIWWLFFNITAQMEWKQNYVCFHIESLPTISRSNCWSK